MIALRLLVAFLLVTISSAASANFFWPPALYYAGMAIWWAIPTGLIAEYLILYPILRLPPSQLLKIVVISNLASAFIGYIATWPVVFWEKGILFFIDYEIWSVLSIAILIFSVNVATEYFVSVYWFQIQRKASNLVGFIAANLASFVTLVLAGAQFIRN